MQPTCVLLLQACYMSINYFKQKETLYVHTDMAYKLLITKSSLIYCHMESICLPMLLIRLCFQHCKALG